MFGWFKTKTLDEHLNQTKMVKVHGIKFKLKKMGVEHFLDGSKVMQNVFDTYKIGADNNAGAETTIKQVKEHWKDVFMASVVDPKLKRKESDPDGILVDNLFTDWNLASELYNKIIDFTYGKKKL